MDLNKIIQMIINTVLRRAVNGAVNKGINYASRMGKSDGPDVQSGQERNEMLKRARQTAKMTRRL